MADLDLAVAGGLDVLSRLLTRGERFVLRKWQRLPDPARSLFARLFNRKHQIVAIDRLDYADIDDINGTAEILASHGFAWCTPSAPLPSSMRLVLYDRSELADICKRLRLPRSGRREVLEERLLACGDTLLRELDRPGIWIRHRGLFRRLCRAFLGRADGDLRMLVLSRMGVVRFPDVPSMGGVGLYPDRRTLLADERARRWARQCLATPALPPGALDAALHLVEQPCNSAPWQRRHRATRYGLAVALAGVAELERKREYEEALSVWTRIRAQDPRAAHAVRQAICLGHLGQAADGARICRTVLDLPATDPACRLALERTGRRLARASGLPWRPSPPLRAPNERSLALVRSDDSGRRPTWTVGNGSFDVETAVVHTLRQRGRHAEHVENDLWTTIFGLLLYDVLFWPVPGMFSGRLAMAPLDLGLPSFAEHRATPLAHALHEIRGDHGLGRLHAAFRDHAGEAIRGVVWNRWTEAHLALFLESITGPVCAEILAALAKGAPRRGFPDVCVLRGPAIRVDGLFPSRIPEECVFVEVKGPGDALRDDQRVWLDSLSRAGASVEVWSIHETGVRAGSR